MVLFKNSTLHYLKTIFFSLKAIKAKIAVICNLFTIFGGSLLIYIVSYFIYLQALTSIFGIISTAIDKINIKIRLIASQLKKIMVNLSYNIKRLKYMIW